MDFDLTEEQRLVQARARDIARREIAPRAADLDRHARWPAEIVARLGEIGLLGVAVPVSLGGAGHDHVSLALVVEEISAACAGSGAIVLVHNALFCDPLLRFGTEAQKREILAPAAAGKAIGTFALTDPRSRADAPSLLTVAERQGDGGFVLNGAKSLVPLGPRADRIVVLAVTGHDGEPRRGSPNPSGPDPEAPRTTAFLVRRDAPGVTVAPPADKLGLRAAPSATIFFENVRVAAGDVLGEEGAGTEVAASTLDGARVAVAAQAVGIARAAFDEAVAHAADPKPDQAIQFMLSDMAVEIDAARLLTLRAARARDRGVRHTRESSMAKLFASEAATRAAHRAVQVFGGHGVTAEHGAERCYRDARMTEIDEGTSELQRSIVAAAVLQG